jgi:hypothetical protein
MELPRPPDDPEMKNIIDKLAQFVARYLHQSPYLESLGIDSYPGRIDSWAP